MALGAVEDAVALHLDVDPERCRRRRSWRPGADGVDRERHGGGRGLGAVGGDEHDRAADGACGARARRRTCLASAQRRDRDVVGGARGALEDDGVARP